SLANARRKFEASVRGIDLPTDIDPQDLDEPGFKSVADRLNWSNSIFAKYRHDNIQQPRRAANTRRKWPNMRYIGTYTLQLGPHVFPETTFYEAVRKELWTDVGIAAGVMKPEDVPKIEPADVPLPTTSSSQPDVTMQKASQPPVDLENTLDPALATSQTAIDATQSPSELINSPTKATVAPSNQAATIDIIPQNDVSGSVLLYCDIVLEFKEVPNERFILPKEAIAEYVQEQREIILSFMLPLAPTEDDTFFREPMQKIADFGNLSREPQIQAAIPTAKKAQQQAKADNSESKEGEDKPVVYQPATIKLQYVDENIWTAINTYLKPLEEVQQGMIAKMQTVPVRHFLQHRTSYDATDDSIESLKNKINTIPETISGPVAAEKKRSELLNAIKLGKRPRSDYTEPEVTHKRGAAHLKDDNLRKCHYCSTRHTSMWRRGPDGGGTLCNGCGLRWKQGEILVGAPVISWKEEKQLAKERKKEEEKIEDDLPVEQEKVEAIEKKKSARYPSSRSNGNDAYKNASDRQHLLSGSGPTPPKNIGYLAAQLAQQQHQQAMLQSTRSGTSSPVVTSTPLSAESSPTQQASLQSPTVPRKKSVGKASATAAKSSPEQPANSSSRLMASAPTPTPTATPMNAVQQSVTSGAGIPLPTLSIVFSDTIFFTHPNCGVALIDDIFSIKLRKDGFDPTTIDIHKQFLQQSQFEIVFEGEGKREILVMTATLTCNTAVTRFDQKLIDPELKTKQHDIKIRFLEKLDPSGGGVVKRILERWVTATPLALSAVNSP
ncbi:hypothetical protein INT43_005930, partial [Umbelopsis isabellina]